MKDDVMISAENVSKKFCRDLKLSLMYGVQDIAYDLVGIDSHKNKLRRNEFWATDDVSFEVKRGECIGLIGRNGAGKTTLLRQINGLIRPDYGSIELNGRVGALIALGAGFNPILTGRENIYINGSVLGLTNKQIEDKIEDIIDFSEIREFIDMPVQSYSSGMQVRLGFSVATALDPDVLLLDEVLAVGDQNFRAKCFNVIGEIKKNAAVMFVSHNISLISLVCDRVIYLERGKIKYIGPTDAGLKKYSAEAATNANLKDYTELLEAPINKFETKLNCNELKSGADITAYIDLAADEDIPNAHLRIIIWDDKEIGIADWSSKRSDLNIDLKKGENKIKVSVGPLILKPGDYWLGFILIDNTGLKNIAWIYRKHHFKLTGIILGGYTIQFGMKEFQLN